MSDWNDDGKKYIEFFCNTQKIDDAHLTDDFNVYKWAVDKAYDDAKRVMGGIQEHNGHKQKALNGICSEIENFFLV